MDGTARFPRARLVAYARVPCRNDYSWSDLVAAKPTAHALRTNEDVTRTQQVGICAQPACAGPQFTHIGAITLRCMVWPRRTHYDKHRSTTALLILQECGRAGASAASRSPQCSFVASSVGRVLGDSSALKVAPLSRSFLWRPACSWCKHRRPAHCQPHIGSFACRFPDIAWVVLARSPLC